MKICFLTFVFVISLVADCTAFGQENDAVFQECAVIEKDADRLACFDRIMGRESGPREAVPADSGHSDSGHTVAAGDSREVSRVAIPTPGVDSGVAGELENASNAQAQEADEFNAIVTALTERPLGHHVVSLNNGQVWQEVFASSYFAVDVGDTVTIRKRFFGGYRLIAESGKGYSVEKVSQ